MIMIQNPVLKRFLKIAVPFLVIPVLAVAGMVCLDTKKHLIVSSACAFFALLLFFTGSERKKTGTRKLVLVSVMTALCLVGRLIPVLKPVTALIILTALYLGKEAGFLTGALSALLSDFYFGQGPWTSFQMLAWGMTGFLAGFFAEPLKHHKLLLYVFGAVSGILFSFIMDIWTVLSIQDDFSFPLYLAKIISAVPYTVSYVISNVLYLVLFRDSVGKKLERIQRKFDI